MNVSKEQYKPNFGYYRNRFWIRQLISLHRKRILPGEFRRFLKHIFQQLIIDVEFSNMKFRCYPFQNYHDLLVSNNELFVHEKNEFNFISERLYSGATFVDIGANIGAYCVFAARSVDHEIQIVAFEPHPLVVERLRYNMEINEIRKYTIFQKAVGNIRGTLPLWVKSNNFGSSSIVRKNGNKKKHYNDIIDVSIEPLSIIVRDNLIKRIDILKIDIEGYEDRALLPYFNDVERAYWPNSIIIEQCHKDLWEVDCIAELLSFGYSIFFQNKSNVLLDLKPE